MATKLVSISSDGKRLLTPDGNSFFAVIVNYVGHFDRAWHWFEPDLFDPALVEADFRLAKETGANTIRTFVDDPLQKEFPKGDWTKLDAVVAAAERVGVRLLLAFADYYLSYVKTKAEHAGRIAARYKGNPTILGYDLKNEPRINDLLFLHYQQPPALLTSSLSGIYPSQRTRQQALDWARGEGKAPSWFKEDQAVAYALARELLEALNDANSKWIADHGFSASAISFIRSAEAQPWQPFIQALDGAVQAWLTPQLEKIRAADPGRLVTVGWSDPLLAGMPANAALDFLDIHRYPQDNTPRQLAYQLNVPAELAAAFPGKPVMLTEFGYATYQLDPAQAAIAESAAWLRAGELGLAGAGKWMLWDLPPGDNPKERSLGLFAAGGAAKPSALALPALAELLAPGRPPRGRLEMDASRPDIAYRFISDDALCAGGPRQIGDERARWAGEGLGQLFVARAAGNALRIRAAAAGQATLDLGKLLGLTDLKGYTLQVGGAAVPHTQAGTTLTFAIAAGQIVTLQLSSLDAVDAKIAILWPHGNAAVDQADLANLTAYLTFPDSRVAVPCDFAPEVILWRSLNNEPAAPAASGVRRLADFGGRRVPVWDFNDVDVSAARDPKNKLYFSARVTGIACRSNVWVHGVDARTFMPQQFQAKAALLVAANAAPAEVDARLQIVWPHDNAPVSAAEQANVTADLFTHGTRTRLGPAKTGAAWRPAVWLARAIDNDVGERVARGVMRPETDGSAHYDFNDVDVSPAREETGKVHFWVEVDGVRVYSNFWTHGADARTYLPNPDVLLGDCTN